MHHRDEMGKDEGFFGLFLKRQVFGNLIEVEIDLKLVLNNGLELEKDSLQLLNKLNVTDKLLEIFLINSTNKSSNQKG